MSQPSQTILLVEDSRHERFIVAYLRKIGFKQHAMRIRKSPSGSAEQWVRTQFAIEVQACLRRPAKTMLVVILDADTHTIQHRFRQMDQALQQVDASLINKGAEAVVRLVPKRNIETWILCVNGRAVDQETDYKQDRNDWTGLIKSGITSLYDWTRPNALLPVTCVESLQIGIRGLRKLDADS
jgi:hypothetical protein